MTGVAKARVPTGGRLTTPNWGLVAPFRSSSSSRTPASHPSPQSLLSTGSGAERVTLLEDLRRWLLGASMAPVRKVWDRTLS